MKNRYYLDSTKEVVEIVQEMEQGWVKIEFSDKRLMNVQKARLTFIPVPIPENSVLVGLTVEFKTPSGQVETRRLGKADSMLWHQWVKELCIRADELDANPSWLSLDWHKERHEKTRVK